MPIKKSNPGFQKLLDHYKVPYENRSGGASYHAAHLFTSEAEIFFWGSDYHDSTSVSIFRPNSEQVLATFESSDIDVLIQSIDNLLERVRNGS